MKNTKEIKPILTALYCINRMEHKDENIEKLLKYAFSSFFDSNTNLLTLACVGRTTNEVMQELNKYLEETTNFKGDLQ